MTVAKYQRIFYGWMLRPIHPQVMIWSSLMRKEYEEKLLKRFPLLFKDSDSTDRFRFQCSDGWFNILWRLCVDLEPLAAELEKETSESFEVVQVKMEGGTLRFCVSHHTDAIDNRIVDAQKESSFTCVVCGRPGRPRSGSWIRTLCQEHVANREISIG